MDLEGTLASVRTHLVKRDQNATDLLDTSNGADEIIRRFVSIHIDYVNKLLELIECLKGFICMYVCMYHCSVKENLHQMMRSPKDFTDDSYKEVS